MAILLTTDDTRREVFLKAEQAKIHTESILPTLDNPASTGDVLKDKDYINGDGDKKIGTLIITDTVQDDGYFGNNGYGVSVNLVSVLDRSTKILELPEPNLKSENIISGVSIFGIGGSAKTMRVESGSITPAEDTKSITIPCTGGAKAFILEATDDVLSAVEGQSLIYAVAFAGTFLRKQNIESAVNTAMTVWYKTQYASGAITAQNSGGVTLSLNFNFYPGTYRWEAYYWEDSV